MEFFIFAFNLTKEGRAMFNLIKKRKPAPITTQNYENIDLCIIMPVFFNQKDTKSLTDSLRVYAGYAPELMRRIQFIIVDDHSPIPISIPEDINLNILLFRVTDDIQWNQAGARNLGATYATSQRMILTDCDHMFTEKLLYKIIDSRVPTKKIFIFKRETMDGKPINSACNIFYISKSTFFSTLGYDEEFCGYYGYEDVMFRYFQKRIGHRLRYFTYKYKIISTTVDRENSYHDLVRDTDRNEKLMEKKKELLLNSCDPFACHSRLFLNFKYEKVMDRRVQ